MTETHQEQDASAPLLVAVADMAVNNTTDDDKKACPSIPSGPVIRSTDRSLRAYSKKFRVYIFREFLLQTYGQYLFGDETSTADGKKVIILDAAGGKGDLSWLLTHVDNVRSIVLDPRICGTNNHIKRSVDYLLSNPGECIKRARRNEHTYQPIAALIPQLLDVISSNKKSDATTTTAVCTDDNSDDLLHKAEQMKIFVNQHLVDAVQRIIRPYGSKDEYIKRVTNINNNRDCNESEIWEQFWHNASLHRECDVNDAYVISSHQIALDVILNAKLIVGFHPDQATDACIELAKILNIPFAIVPCCVFPSEFTHRRILIQNPQEMATAFHTDDMEGADDTEKMLLCQPVNEEEENEDLTAATSMVETRPVKRYDDLLIYLKQRHPDIKSQILPFEGTSTAKNLALYTLPP